MRDTWGDSLLVKTGEAARGFAGSSIRGSSGRGDRRPLDTSAASSHFVN